MTKKEPMTTRLVLKAMARGALLLAIRLYKWTVQLSKVMIWKTVRIDSPMLSNVAIPY